MPSTTTPRTPLLAAAVSDPGLRRENNEDRYHCDPERGLFMVIDGVGGQAAGEKAADTALAMLRTRLERETGSPADRLREAITLANNEVYRLAQEEPAWKGMACVLTVALVRDGRATIGHVGDTRLYLLRDEAMQKITHDHSPVGEREDEGELDEAEAMRHPRRNEIFRDVGSEPHEPADEDFVEIVELPFHTDSALLLCTDGLTDLVRSATIADIAYTYGDRPQLVVERLIEAANDSGGKDNVTAVFVAGSAFAEASRPGRGAGPVGGRIVRGPGGTPRHESAVAWPWLLVALGLGAVIGLLASYAGWMSSDRLSERLLQANRPAGWARTWKVGLEPDADFITITDALRQAQPGDVIQVDPGVYDSHFVLDRGVQLVSRRPHEAILAPRAEHDPRGPGVTIRGGSRLAGFRIAGVGERRLGIGIRIEEGEVDDVEVLGAETAAIVFAPQSRGILRASRVTGNPGVGVVVDAGALPRLFHNVISGNGTMGGGESPDARAKPQVELRDGADAVFEGNIIAGSGLEQIQGLPAARRAAVALDNVIGAPAQAQRPKPQGRTPR
jgi:serine/threonine protein phosphatase PrpC